MPFITDDEARVRDLTRGDGSPTSIYIVLCNWCGDSSELRLTVADVEAWKADTLIQDAFPYLVAAERELVKTGYHPECWSDMFGYE